MSRELANRIAAGEVVERPSSVVKELVENSIDAGADRIKVTIEKAGTRLIQVTDNGCGMDEEDALLAFEEHGTSKLADDDDLLTIGTLGFRGEAIPSIASVSRFTLRTRRRDAEAGIKVTVDAGILVSSSPDGCAAGTTIEIRDLFYNVPARKKFLKSPATEEHHIEETLLNLALGHFEQSFELRIDKRVSFNSAGSATPELRIRELFGRSFANNLLPVEHSENNVRITGFIASPGFTRPGRREQRVFVNRRAIESQAVFNGIREGYGTINTESGRYPPAVLYIDIPNTEVDVNVHPAKREVRFKSEYSITRCVANAVASALRRSAEQLPEDEPVAQQIASGISIDNILKAAMVQYEVKKTEQAHLDFNNNTADEKEPVPQSAPEKEPIPTVVPPGNGPVPPQPAPEKEPEFKDLVCKDMDFEIDSKTGYMVMPDSIFFNDPPKGTSEPAPFEPAAQLPEEAVFRGNWPTAVLGIWNNTYILCNSPNGLVIVDQHAAHERVLFEKISDRAKNGGCASQMLLIPRSLELRNSEHRLLMKNRNIFEKLGFEFEETGGTTVLVSALPAELAEICRPPEELIPDMLEELLTRQNHTAISVDYDAAARAACHNAIRANDAITLKEAEILLAELKKCRQGTMCPHGRPTMITLSARELEKRFQRR